MTTDTLLLTFEPGRHGDLIARAPGGKICLPARGRQAPAAGESWVCEVEQHADRFIRVRPVVREHEVRWGWVPSTEYVALGVPMLEWRPVEPALRGLSLRAPPCPPGQSPLAVNEGFAAAQSLEKALRRGFGDNTRELFARLGWPDEVQPANTSSGDDVDFVWHHPRYGVLRATRAFKALLRPGARYKMHGAAWRAVRPYQRPWLVTWTGALRMPASGNPRCAVQAEAVLAAWPDVRVWVDVGSASGGVDDIGVPRELLAKAKAMIVEGAQPLSEYLAEYEAVLAAWRPWWDIYLRALWLADRTGAHSRVSRHLFTYEKLVVEEDGWHHERTYTVAVKVRVARDIGVTGYLQSCAPKKGGRFGARLGRGCGGDKGPREPDIKPRAIMPSWPVHMYLEAGGVDAFGVVIREAEREWEDPDISQWPSVGEPSLGEHPADAARAQVLAARAQVLASRPKAPTAPKPEVRIAYTEAQLQEFNRACAALVEARIEEFWSEAETLVPAILDIYDADAEWVDARAQLVSAGEEAQRLLREVRGVTVPKALLDPAPERPAAITGSEMREEAVAMRERTLKLRRELEAAVQAQRLPLPVPVPVFEPVPVRAGAPLASKLRAPARWQLFGIEAAEVADIVGVPEGTGLSGLVGTDGKAEPGAHPLVAIRVPSPGGKRWAVQVAEMHGLHPVVDVRGSRRFGPAVLLIAAVTSPDWRVVVETTYDHQVVQADLYFADSDPTGSN